MESRKHSRTISPEESAKLEEFVFDLVRERLLSAVGAGGMWTLQFRTSTDTDSLFGETIAEYIARDIANQIAIPSAAVDIAEPSNWREVEMVLEDALDNVDYSTGPAPAGVTAVEEQPDEHRVFRPRRAA